MYDCVVAVIVVMAYVIEKLNGTLGSVYYDCCRGRMLKTVNDPKRKNVKRNNRTVDSKGYGKYQACSWNVFLVVGFSLPWIKEKLLKNVGFNHFLSLARYHLQM